MVKFYNTIIAGVCAGFALSLVSCHTTSRQPVKEDVDSIPYTESKERPADTSLTDNTKALWLNLKSLRGQGIIFGQQDATVVGVDGKYSEDLSDVKKLTGTNPALYGWEISGVGSATNIDSIPFSLLKQRICSAYKRGGINTVTWLMNNPVTGGSARDVTPALQQVLPDSSLIDYYKDELQKVATFFNQLKAADGTLVPVIFRPFHESNGSWFWWGKGHCTPQEYISLWRFTITFLRDSLHVHNLLYAYSTDLFESKEQYLERYPGDEWVDIMGSENYRDFQSGASIGNGISQLGMLVEMAGQRKKLAALTECGFDGVPVKNWWTQFLLNPIKTDSLAHNISYLMVWRNTSHKNYYTPFPDQKSTPDFITFEQDSFTIFEKDLKGIYLPDKK
jgi:mannan endo-1,4-beta-mannosidase